MGEFLLARGTPRIILCGVTPRTLLENDRRWTRSALYWDWSDWRERFAEDRPTALSVWPVVARNWIGGFWQTLRYRDKPLVLIDELWVYYERHRDAGPTLSLGDFLAGRTFPSPLNGDLTARQAFDEVSLATRPIPEERVENYVAALLTDGRYPMGERRIRELRALAEVCDARGVPLMFYEVPVAEILQRHLPEDVYPRFYEHMRRIDETTPASFLPLDSLGVRFEDADFAEQSHVNLQGARKLTRALLTLPVLEALSPAGS
jgi:hypothetical protein